MSVLMLDFMNINWLISIKYFNINNFRHQISLVESLLTPMKSPQYNVLQSTVYCITVPVHQSVVHSAVHSSTLQSTVVDCSNCTKIHFTTIFPLFGKIKILRIFEFQNCKSGN